MGFKVNTGKGRLYQRSERHGWLVVTITIVVVGREEGGTGRCGVRQTLEVLWRQQGQRRMGVGVGVSEQKHHGDGERQ
jgi:hypothetical protein